MTTSLVAGGQLLNSNSGCAARLPVAWPTSARLGASHEDV